MLNARNVATVFAVLFLVLSFAALPGVDAEPAQGAGDLIYVPVMVTDNKNVPVATLKETDFQLLEDNKEQKITSFSPAGEPLTLAVVLGLSANGPVKNAGQRDRTTVDITNAVETVRGAASSPQVEQIPLDADTMFSVVQRAMENLSKQPGMRRALVVVSDGYISSGMAANNAPLPKAAIEASKVSPVPVHFLAPYPNTTNTAPSFQEGTTLSTGYYLQQIAEFSGGEVLTGQIENDLAKVATGLRDRLKNQYVLGYKSPNTAKDGKWRKIQVKINPAAGKFKLITKERYFVPKA
jgi:Ca-activated chloride channel family protein